MADPAFDLRVAEAGALVRGTPGNVLTFQPDGSLAGEAVGPGAVTSVFARMGAVVPVAGDYDSDQITDVSGVSAGSVSDALVVNETAAASATSAAAAAQGTANSAGTAAATAQSTANAAGSAALAAAADAATAQTTANSAGTAAATAQSSATAAGTAAATAQTTANSAGTAAATAQSTANTAVTAAATADAKAVAAQQPFRATYYVNPTFAGTATGSQSAPFTTAAAGFAAAIAAGFAAALLLLPPATTLTENIVFPSTGGNWEIASVGMGIEASTGGSRISGTITCDSTGTSRIRLTNLSVTGNTSGLCSAGSLSFCATAVRQNGSITLTTSGAGVITAFFRGLGVAEGNKQGGSNTLAVSVAGRIVAENWVFEGGCTEATPTTLTPYNGSTWRSCQLGSTNSTPVTMNLNGVSNAFFYDCFSAGPVTFACAVANYIIYMDGATLAAFNYPLAGTIVTGTGVQLKQLNGQASAATTVAGNVGSTAYGSRSPAGLYVADLSLVLKVAGTLGALQFSFSYTDSTGALVTETLGGTLNIAGAVGTTVRAQSLPFEHNGAAASIAFTFTGVTTAGAMSVSHISAVRRLN